MQHLLQKRPVEEFNQTGVKSNKHINAFMKE